MAFSKIKGDLDEFTFIMLNAEIYSIARLLFPLHEVAYLYLFGKLNTVFVSNVSHPEQLALAVKVPEEIITLQQMFTDGLVMCCDVDYDSEGVTQSGRFLAFTALHQEFMLNLQSCLNRACVCESADTAVNILC